MARLLSDTFGRLSNYRTYVYTVEYFFEHAIHVYESIARTRSRLYSIVFHERFWRYHSKYRAKSFFRLVRQSKYTVRSSERTHGFKINYTSIGEIQSA